MKVGIYLAPVLPVEGGAWSFQEHVVRNLIDELGSDRCCTVSEKRESGFPVPHVQLPHWRQEHVLRRAAARLKLVSRDISKRIDSALESSIDLLYSPTPWIPSRRLPFIVTCWDLQHRINPIFPEIRNSWVERENIYRKTLPQASRIITGTEQGKQEIASFYGVAVERIVVIPFELVHPFGGIEATLPEAVPFPSGSFLFYPAQFWPHKNHITILQCVAELKRQGIHVNAVMSGADRDKIGTLSYLQRECRSLGISEQVCFPGFVTDGELKWLYRNALCLVFASFFGPDNLPPIEAMSQECPVIASAVPGALEQLGDAAILIEPGNELQMVDAVKRIRTNEKLRSTLVSKGIKLVDTLKSSGYAQEVTKQINDLERYVRCWKSLSS